MSHLRALTWSCTLKPKAKKEFELHNIEKKRPTLFLCLYDWSYLHIGEWEFFLSSDLSVQIKTFLFVKKTKKEVSKDSLCTAIRLMNIACKFSTDTLFSGSDTRMHFNLCWNHCEFNAWMSLGSLKQLEVLKPMALVIGGSYLNIYLYSGFS